jgi:hypothetical protein
MWAPHQPNGLAQKWCIIIFVGGEELYVDAPMPFGFALYQNLY